MNSNIKKISESYDPNKVEWRQYKDSSCKEFKIDFDYSLLGYDIESCRLDMLLRYPKGKSHCRRHRHIASTLTLVLEGEQHITELDVDGSKNFIHRKKGDYALAHSDALPHFEHGGDMGGTVLLSMHAKDGILFEYFDENMKNGWTVSIIEYVESWNAGIAYGDKSGTPSNNE
tara:strand:- start:13 stop:531 length:519 start_codon:yes stop_codon:yes gene_type:complete